MQTRWDISDIPPRFLSRDVPWQINVSWILAFVTPFWLGFCHGVWGTLLSQHFVVRSGGSDWWFGVAVARYYMLPVAVLVYGLSGALRAKNAGIMGGGSGLTAAALGLVEILFANITSTTLGWT